MYEIKKTNGKEIREVERRKQQQIDGYDDREVKNLLVDSFGRIGKKLRISVTDKCNMRCTYCMPRGKVSWLNEHDVLNYNEIARLVTILADLGIDRIRLTGGEPLIRPDLQNLIFALTKIEGIKSISMTTNGILFGEKARAFKAAGLEGVNVSLDTFKPARFKEITGVNRLDTVIEAINAAEEVGLSVKINTVVIRGWNDDEIVDFANYARDTGHVVRFIEFMPLDGSGIWRSNLVYTKREMIELINRSLGGLVPLDNFSKCDLNYTNDMNYNTFFIL